MALLGLGLWLRLRFVQAVQLYPDEFVTLLAVQMIGQKGLPVMPSGLFYEHGLLFSYLGSLAALFGPIRLAARFASLLCGLLTVGLTFWLGHRWFSPAVGLMAATGLTIAPAAIAWSGRARMYALLQLLVLLTLWLAYEGLVQRKAAWRWAALLTYLGATLSHFVAVTLAPPLILAAISFRWRQTKVEKQRSEAAEAQVGTLTGPGAISPLPPPSPAPQWWTNDREWWLEAVALVGILVIAFLVKRAGQPKGIEALEASQALSGLAQVLAIYGDLSLNLVKGWQAIAPFYLSLPALIFVPFALVAMLVSFIALITRQRDKNSALSPAPLLPGPPAFFLTLILLITTLEMILFVSPDRRDDKYLFMLLPVLFLLGAHGLSVVSNQGSGVSNQGSGVRDRWSVVGGQGSGGSRYVSRFTSSALRVYASRIPYLISHLAPLLISGLILIVTQPAVQVLLANTGDDYDSAFAYVQSHWQAGDTILTGTPTAAAFYLGRNDFYSVQRRGGYDYRILTVNGRAVDRWLASPAIRTETALHQTLADHNVWLVLERWGLQREYYDLPFQQQLLAQTDYVSQTQGIFILRSKPEPRPLTLNPARPAEAVFGDRVRLIGYTIEPEQPEPGQTLRLTLYWRALAPMSHDYTVFVHVRPPGGGNVAQADHRPLGNLYPTTLWPVGETIRERSDLFLPAELSPGAYDLWVGLYLLETGQRLPVQNDTSGENAVKLGRLTVGK